MKVIFTFVGVEKGTGKLYEQKVPMDVPSDDPDKLPAVAASVLQGLIAPAGIVYKDPDVKGRISLKPTDECSLLYCDVPSIVIANNRDIITP